MATVVGLEDDPEKNTPRAGTAGINADPGDSVFEGFPSLVGGDTDNAVPFVSTDHGSTSTITAAQPDVAPTNPTPVRDLNSSFNPMNLSAERSEEIRLMLLQREREALAASGGGKPEPAAANFKNDEDASSTYHDVSEGSNPDEAFLPDSVSSTTLFNWLQTKDPAAYKRFLNDMRSAHRSTVPSPPKPAANSFSTPAPADISSALEPLLQDYDSLDDETKKEIWLGALKSLNPQLIARVSELRKPDLHKTLLPKLTKELLTHAEKQAVSILKYDDNANKRRYNHQRWITGIKTVMEMFKETQGIIVSETIVPYQDPKCVGNQAVFILVNSKVDNYFKQVLTRVPKLGDKALQLLQTLCANVTSNDRHHYHHLFTNMRITTSESVTHFLYRFIIGRNQSELVGNTYQDTALVSYFLSAISSTTHPAYMILMMSYQNDIDSNRPVTFEDLEKRFMAIDEKAIREKQNKSLAQGAIAQRVKTDRKLTGKGNQAKANAVTSTSAEERDLSRLKCYNCGLYGHFSKDCPKPDKRLAKTGDQKNNANNDRRRGKKKSTARANAASSSVSTDGTLDHGCYVRTIQYNDDVSTSEYSSTDDDDAYSWTVIPKSQPAVISSSSYALESAIYDNAEWNTETFRQSILDSMEFLQHDSVTFPIAPELLPTIAPKLLPNDPIAPIETVWNIRNVPSPRIKHV